MQNFNSAPLVNAVRKILPDLGVMPISSVLIGVSGGVDSMVLLYVLKNLKYPVSASHVNFGLRGSESDEDAVLVRSWCMENEVPYYEHRADTRKYSNEHHLNIQSAAREIRYGWWGELMNSGSFDFVATAHHRDDAIETFFLNLFRGTGIKGLTGIPAKRDFFIRPLIRVSKTDIESFAAAHHIPFRADRSNESDDYQRNRIRHHLIPILKDYMPDPGETMDQTIHRIRIEWEAWEFAFNTWQTTNVLQNDDHFILKSTPEEHPFLLRWLEMNGFPWQLSYDYIKAVLPETGKTLDHDRYQLSRTKDGFYLETINFFQPVTIPGPGVFKAGDDEISIETVSMKEFSNDADPDTEYIDRAGITWPLILRQVQQGDHFQPLGMHGQSKKLQDFLVDLKLDLFEKRRIKVLASNHQIIWVVGRRLDERFRIKPGTKEIYKLMYKKGRRDKTET